MTTVNAAQLREIIERALRRELAARRELRPHVQLAIAPDADRQMIEEAYGRLRRCYAPADYAQHGERCMAVAGEIGALIEAAYQAMAHADVVSRAETTGEARAADEPEVAPSFWRALGAKLRRLVGGARPVPEIET